MVDNVNDNMSNGTDDTKTDSASKVPAPAVFSASMNGSSFIGLQPKRLAKRLQRMFDSVDIPNASFDVDYISAEAYGSVCEALAESYTYGEQIRGSLNTVINSSLEYGQAARRFCDGFMDEYDAFKRTHPDNSARDAVSRADRIVIVKRDYSNESGQETASFTIKVFEIARTATAEKRMAEAKAITSGLRVAFGVVNGDENGIAVTVYGTVKHSPFSALFNWSDRHIDSDHDVIHLVAIGTGFGAVVSAVIGNASVLSWVIVSAMFWLAYHLGDFGGNGLVLDMIFKLDSVGLLASQPRVTLRYSNISMYLLAAVIILSFLYPMFV